MTRYIAAIDQGTTSTRCMIFDHAGQVVARAQEEHAQMYPQPGWVEHDPLEIWQRTQEVVRRALEQAGLTPADLAAVVTDIFLNGLRGEATGDRGDGGAQ